MAINISRTCSRQSVATDNALAEKLESAARIMATSQDWPTLLALNDDELIFAMRYAAKIIRRRRKS